MSYKHLEDIQNIYEQISEPVDKQLVSEASAILIDTMFSEGYSEDAIAQFVLNANPDDIVHKIVVNAENYIYIDASELNESFDGVEYEILEENSQQVANLQELVEAALLARAAGALAKVAKPAVRGLAIAGKRAGQLVGKVGSKITGKASKASKAVSDKVSAGAKAAGAKVSAGATKAKSGGKALIGNIKSGLKSTGNALKKYGPTAALAGGAGLVGVPLAIGGAKLAVKGAKAVGGAIKKGYDTAKTFVKGGVDAVKDKNISKQVDDYVKKNKGDKPIRKIDPAPYNRQEKPKEEPKTAEIKKPSTASGKELPKPRAIGKGKGEINPNSARGQMIAKNKEIHGGDKIKKLRDKNAAFQAAKKSGSNYSMDDFVKDFPDSNTAKDRRKSKKIAPPGWDESYDAKGDDNIVEDRYKTDLHRKQDYHKKPYDKKGRATGKVRRNEQDIGRLIRSIQTDSYDAFDIVSNYLIDSKQVENMDEALYVMSEMDAKTIQGIVEHHQKDADGNTVPHE